MTPRLVAPTAARLAARLTVLVPALLAAPLSAEAPVAAATAPPPRVLVLSLDPIGVDPTLAQSIDPLVASAAGSLAGDVMSETDLKQLAEMEANKAAMGCDTSSCLAEIAGAMGAELVLYGTVSQLGSSTVVTLSLFDSKASSIRRNVLTTSDLGVLPDEVPPRVEALMLEARPVLAARAAARQSTSSAHEAAPEASGGAVPWLALGALGVGGVLAVAGGVLVVVNELRAGDAATDAADKQTAQLWGRVGIGVAAVGVIVAAVGGVLFAVGGDE